MLEPCLAASRILAKSKGPNRNVWVERHIDDYLRTDAFGLSLERIRKAIDYEELERREGGLECGEALCSLTAAQDDVGASRL